MATASWSNTVQCCENSFNATTVLLNTHRSIGEHEFTVNICLFSNFLLKITFLTWTHNTNLFFNIATLKVQAFVIKWYQWIKINISDNKTQQGPIFPHSYPEGSSICHNMLSVDVFLQNRILGFANGTTVRQLLALPLHFGICNHQDASSKDRKEKCHLVPHQGCTVDVQDTPIQIAATRLPSVRLCRVLTLSDFHLSGSPYAVGIHW